MVRPFLRELLHAVEGQVKAKLMAAAAPMSTLLCTSSGRVCASGLMAEAAAMKSAAVLISRQRAISSCK